MAPKTWKITGIALLVLAAAIVVIQVAAAYLQPLPVYMPLPDVSLVDQDGRPFDLTQTRGKVVLLSPIYTHCPDICPLTTSKVKQIQERLKAAGLSGEVQLLSVSMDPQRDTARVLKAFAANYGADLSNWAFLTGPEDQTNLLIKDLGMYVERVYFVDGTEVPQAQLPNPRPGTPYLVNHSDRMFLADRQGRVRALPPGSRSDVDEVMKQIQQIVRIKDGS